MHKIEEKHGICLEAPRANAAGRLTILSVSFYENEFVTWHADMQAIAIAPCRTVQPLWGWTGWLLPLVMVIGCAAMDGATRPRSDQDMSSRPLVRAVLSLGLCRAAPPESTTRVEACAPDQRIGVQEVIDPVIDRRRRQAGDPGSTFIPQTGVYQHRHGDTIIEPSLSVIIWKSEVESRQAFTAHIAEVARILARHFDQEAILVEFQVAHDVRWIRWTEGEQVAPSSRQ